LCILKELTHEIKSIKTTAPTQLRFPKKTLDSKTKPLCKLTDKYCWIYGVGNHNVKECRCRAQGYKEKATFQNHLGRSNTYSNWQGESGIGNNINILDKVYCNHLPLDSPIK